MALASRARPPPGAQLAYATDTQAAAQRRYPAARRGLTSYSCCSVGVVAAGARLAREHVGGGACGGERRTFHEAVPDAHHCVVRSARGYQARGGDVRPSEKAVKRTQGKTWFDMVVAV